MKTFDLTIVTPQGVLYDDTAESLCAIGLDGAFGIMAQHTPMLALLRVGALKVRKNSQRLLQYQCGAGVLEVRDNRVTILADQCAPLDYVPVAEH